MTLTHTTAAYGRHMTLRSRAFDLGLAACVGVLGQLEVWVGLGASNRQEPLWVQSALYAITSALLVFRRDRPLLVLGAIVAVSSVSFLAVGSPEGNGVVLAPMIAAYTVARYRPLRPALVGLLLIVVLSVLWAVMDPLNTTSGETVLALVWSAPGIIAWMLGALVRTAVLNAEQRRINVAQRASQQVVEERLRIARELPDGIGHSVSVMTLQSSAVRRRLLPSQVAERTALETVEGVGRQTLSEMRRMVNVLRGDEGTALLPQPGLGELEDLVDDFRAAGLPVTLDLTGDVAALPPGQDLVAYRIVQEALTNSLKHAQGATGALVRVKVAPTAVEIHVRDDGDPTPGNGSDEGAPGIGLLGMRERVAVYGGSMRAGPCERGGFEVEASLPLESP